MSALFIKTFFAIICFSSVAACADSSSPEKLDVRDQIRAIELKKWEKSQEELPDSERYLLAGFGEDLLVPRELGVKSQYCSLK